MTDQQLVNRVLDGDRQAFERIIKNTEGLVNQILKMVKYLRLEYKPDNVAVLTMKTFFDGFLQQTGENFKAFLDSSFKDLEQKGARKLIIDIRGNQGGNDENGALLYAYLSPKPFKYYESKNSTSEFFSETHNPNLTLQYPMRNNFNGKVYFLIDGRSFSGAAEFAAHCKKQPQR